MNYLHYKCNVMPEHYIKVILSAKANVKLLDTVNYYKYQSGKQYKLTCEYPQVSSIDIRVPFKSIWHVVIEHSDFQGVIKANVHVV